MVYTVQFNQIYTPSILNETGNMIKYFARDAIDHQNFDEWVCFCCKYWLHFLAITLPEQREQRLILIITINFHMQQYLLPRCIIEYKYALSIAAALAYVI